MEIEILQRLKNVNLDGNNMEEMVALVAFGETLAKKFEALEMEIPDWVNDNIRALGREIDSRKRDQDALELKHAKRELKALMPVDQKRSDLTAKIERLEAKLNK